MTHKSKKWDHTVNKGPFTCSNGVRRWKCEYCQHVYHYNTSVWDHMKKMHNIDPPAHEEPESEDDDDDDDVKVSKPATPSTANPKTATPKTVPPKTNLPKPTPSAKRRRTFPPSTDAENVAVTCLENAIEKLAGEQLKYAREQLCEHKATIKALETSNQHKLATMQELAAAKKQIADQQARIKWLEKEVMNQKGAAAEFRATGELVAARRLLAEQQAIIETNKQCSAKLTAARKQLIEQQAKVEALEVEVARLERTLAEHNVSAEARNGQETIDTLEKEVAHQKRMVEFRNRELQGKDIQIEACSEELRYLRQHVNSD